MNASRPVTADSCPAIAVEGLTHRYGSRTALDQLQLTIERGELFAIVGPNGGGKTTLFRLLSTLIRPQAGDAKILGHSLRTSSAAIRPHIGVVFQAPSVDRKLTVGENIRYQAHLYGLTGVALQSRLAIVLEQFGLTDRQHDFVEKLSGGLRRRVELAKGLVHQPTILLLDEPSTGLDPGARSDLWQILRSLVVNHRVTVVLTTHYLDEAAGADRVAILSQGKLMGVDTPEALCRSVGGDAVLMETSRPDELAATIRRQLSLSATVMDGIVRLEVPDGHTWVSRLVELSPGSIQSIRVGKPTLEDVFIARTGHRFWQVEEQSHG